MNNTYGIKANQAPGDFNHFNHLNHLNHLVEYVTTDTLLHKGLVVESVWDLDDDHAQWLAGRYGLGESISKIPEHYVEALSEFYKFEKGKSDFNGCENGYLNGRANAHIRNFASAAVLCRELANHEVVQFLVKAPQEAVSKAAGIADTLATKINKQFKRVFRIGTPEQYIKMAEFFEGFAEYIQENKK